VIFMRHHDFIQKKIIGYLNDYYFTQIEQGKLSDQEKEGWDSFLTEIINFDQFDNYVDQLVLEDKRIVALQYFYSHTDLNGALDELEKASIQNIWVKDNMNYYQKVEKIINNSLKKNEESEKK